MSFEIFCDAFAIKPGRPALVSELEAAETKLGVPLPASVRKVYESGNGGKAKNDLSSLQIYSIKTALQYAKVPRFFDAPWALWPLIENDDSNPVCVCCRAPLTGYVVLMSHDDAPRILFRSLKNFFAAASEFVSTGEYLDTSELAGDFAAPERTRADVAAAKRLGALARKLDGEEQIDALCFAADLFGDEDVDEIRGLLEFDRAEASDYVTERIGRIKGAKRQKSSGSATGQSKAVKESFDEFVVRCGKILVTAGLRAEVVEMYGKNTIRLNPGPVWMNMQFFFESRKRADFSDYLLDLAQKAVKGKKRK